MQIAQDQAGPLWLGDSSVKEQEGEVLVCRRGRVEGGAAFWRELARCVTSASLLCPAPVDPLAATALAGPVASASPQPGLSSSRESPGGQTTSGPEQVPTEALRLGSLGAGDRD